MTDLDPDVRWDHQQHYDTAMRMLESDRWQLALVHMLGALYRLQFEWLGHERSKR